MRGGRAPRRVEVDQRCWVYSRWQVVVGWLVSTETSLAVAIVRDVEGGRAGWTVWSRTRSRLSGALLSRLSREVCLSWAHQVLESKVSGGVVLLIAAGGEVSTSFPFRSGSYCRAGTGRCYVRIETSEQA